MHFVQPKLDYLQYKNTKHFWLRSIVLLILIAGIMALLDHFSDIHGISTLSILFYSTILANILLICILRFCMSFKTIAAIAFLLNLFMPIVIGIFIFIKAIIDYDHSSTKTIKEKIRFYTFIGLLCILWFIHFMQNIFEFFDMKGGIISIFEAFYQIKTQGANSDEILDELFCNYIPVQGPNDNVYLTKDAIHALEYRWSQSKSQLQSYLKSRQNYKCPPGSEGPFPRLRSQKKE